MSIEFLIVLLFCLAMATTAARDKRIKEALAWLAVASFTLWFWGLDNLSLGR